MDNLPLHHLVVIVCSETSKTVSYHSRFWGKLLCDCRRSYIGLNSPG